MKRMLIIGDSIALGVIGIAADETRTTIELSYVEQLRLRLSDWEIVVDAAFHRTTTHAVALLPKLLAEHRPQCVLLFLGGNDVDISWKQFILTDGRRIRHNTPLDKFEQNIRQLVEMTQHSDARMILAALPHQDVMRRGRYLNDATGRDVVGLIESVGGIAQDAERHRRYADVIKRVAAETGATLLRWTDRLARFPAEQHFGPDAMHPGEAAHAVIAETMAELLEQSMEWPVARALAVAPT